MLIIVLSLFILGGFLIGKNINRNSLFYNIFYSFCLLNLFANFIPSSYALLWTNYHIATFLYLAVLILLGVVLIKIVSIHSNSNVNLINTLSICFCIGFITYGQFFTDSGYDLLFTVLAIITNLFLGLYISKQKFLIGLASCLLFILGGILKSVVIWQFGYILSLFVGIISYFLVSNLRFVISKDNKEVIGLIIGMILVFLGIIL